MFICLTLYNLNYFFGQFFETEPTQRRCAHRKFFPWSLHDLKIDVMTTRNLCVQLGFKGLMKQVEGLFCCILRTKPLCWNIWERYNFMTNTKLNKTCPIKFLNRSNQAFNDRILTLFLKKAIRIAGYLRKLISASPFQKEKASWKISWSFGFETTSKRSKLAPAGEMETFCQYYRNIRKLFQHLFNLFGLNWHLQSYNQWCCGYKKFQDMIKYEQ